MQDLVRNDVFGRPTEAWNGTTVKITYRDAKGDVTERVVTDVVFRPAGKNGEMMMVGNDRLRHACRSFHIDRIESLVALDPVAS